MCLINALICYTIGINMAHVTLRELIQDDLQVHGLEFVLNRYKKKVCFTHMYWLIFGKAPR